MKETRDLPLGLGDLLDGFIGYVKENPRRVALSFLIGVPLSADFFAYRDEIHEAVAFAIDAVEVEVEGEDE